MFWIVTIDLFIVEVPAAGRSSGDKPALVLKPHFIHLALMLNRWGEEGGSKGQELGCSLEVNTNVQNVHPKIIDQLISASFWKEKLFPIPGILAGAACLSLYCSEVQRLCDSCFNLFIPYGIHLRFTYNSSTVHYYHHTDLFKTSICVWRYLNIRILVPFC